MQMVKDAMTCLTERRKETYGRMRIEWSISCVSIQLTHFSIPTQFRYGFGDFGNLNGFGDFRQ